MPYLLKPAFEQARRTAITGGRPSRDAELAKMQAALVTWVETLGPVLFEKAKRPHAQEAFVEIHAAWVGPASDPAVILKLMKDRFPGEAFPDPDVDFTVEQEDEFCALRWVGSGDGRFQTGRITIRT